MNQIVRQIYYVTNFSYLDKQVRKKHRAKISEIKDKKYEKNI